MASTGTARTNQCQKPTGWLGRLSLWQMNARHSKLTDWGLRHVTVEKRHTILDVGCGGGRTVSKLAAMATEGKVYGIDHSEESVAASRRTNARWIAAGRVEIQHGSVSQLPFPKDIFDLVTAVETHFWWPTLSADMLEIFRVLRPGGKLIIIAEVYKGAKTTVAKLVEKYAPRTGITLLSVDEHRELFEKAGYSDVKIIEQSDNGWICGVGTKSLWCWPAVPRGDTPPGCALEQPALVDRAAISKLGDSVSAYRAVRALICDVQALGTASSLPFLNSAGNSFVPTEPSTRLLSTDHDLNCGPIHHQLVELGAPAAQPLIT